MALALFDFDGTITTRDTLLDFARYVRGDRAFFGGMLALLPKLVLYKLGVYRNDRMKESFLKKFFGGTDERRFRDVAREYSLTKIDGIVDPQKRNLLDFHKSADDRIVVVSASIEDWIAPWCTEQGLEYVATRLEVMDGKVTGRLATPNCFGPEKVRRVCDYLDLKQYPEIYVYGNSRGDRDMEWLRTAALPDSKTRRFEKKS